MERTTDHFFVIWSDWSHWLRVRVSFDLIGLKIRVTVALIGFGLGLGLVIFDSYTVYVNYFLEQIESYHTSV